MMKIYNLLTVRMLMKRRVFRQSDGWQLPEGGDFEALHCQPSRNFDRSTKLDLTTEPPLLGRCCYAFAFSFEFKFVSYHSHICPTMNAASAMKNCPFLVENIFDYCKFFRGIYSPTFFQLK